MINQLERLQGLFRKKMITKEEYIHKMHEIHRMLWDYREYIQNKNVESIDITREKVILTTREGFKLVCDPEDERIVPIEILNFGDYEADEIRMMRRLLTKDGIVIDVGANIGWYTINLAKYVPDGKVIAFEPIPKTFEYLKQNVALNDAANVQLHNFGLSEKEGTFEFFYDPTLSGAASLRNLHEGSKKKKIQCKVKKMDDVISGLVSRIDLIKCDVEGAELFVMRGGLATLTRHTPALFLEMLRKWSAKFNYHPNDIIKLLRPIGYECYYIRGKKLKKIIRITERTLATNFYFLHPVRHRESLRKLT